LGISKVAVFRKPKIAIVSTGDELQDLGEELAEGKIRNSNSYSLAAYIGELGGEPIVIGTAADKIDEVVSLIAKGLEQADMLITTGGVSVGDYDLVQEAARITFFGCCQRREADFRLVRQSSSRYDGFSTFRKSIYKKTSWNFSIFMAAD
jgi:molybdenum cofactor synthesis domain-containing protein